MDSPAALPGVTELAQPASALGRAVEQFNRRALHLTRPGSHWLLSSIKICLGTMAVTVPLIILTLLVRAMLRYTESESDPDRKALSLVFGAVLFSPFVETALLVLIYKMTWARLGLTGFVMVNTMLWAVAHIPLQPVPIGAAILFLVMSYQYVSFRDGVGARKAFWGVFVFHATNNGIATALLLSARWFGE